jgi:hypothetical protein
MQLTNQKTNYGVLHHILVDRGLIYAQFFDVITSLVSIEYGGYGCDKVTSQSEDDMDLTLTSLRVISMVRGHVIVT